MIELLDHNKETYKKALSLLQKKKRVGIVQATSTGKSFVVMRLIEEMFITSKVLFVVPYKAIIKSITAYKEWSFSNVTFSTYSNLQNVDVTQYELIILDEAHHCLAPVWKTYVKPLFLLDNYILGMTATEVRNDNTDVMKELFNDCTVYGLQVEDAVSAGILPNSDYIICDTAIAQRVANIKEHIYTGSNISVFDDVFALQLSDVVNKYVNLGVTKWIVFHKSLESLKLSNISDMFPENVEIYDYTSKMSNIDCDRNLSSFIKADRAVINSVSMLNEGVHIKGVTGIILLQHTDSALVFKQRIGRVLSTHNLNKVSVIIDAADNYTNIRKYAEEYFTETATSNAYVNKTVISNFIHLVSARIESLFSVLEEYENTITQPEAVKTNKQNILTEYEIGMIKKHYPKYGMSILYMVPTLTKSKVIKVIQKYKIKFKGLWSFDDDMRLMHGQAVEGKTEEECMKRKEYLRMKGMYL